MQRFGKACVAGKGGVMGHPNLLELLGRAASHPSRVEFVTASGTEVSSFAELWRWSELAVQPLKALARGCAVAGVLTPSPHVISCAVGCLRAGLDFVSLPMPGRGQPPSTYVAQILSIMASVGAERLVLEARHMSLLGAFAPALLGVSVSAEEVLAAGDASSCGDYLPGRLVQFSSGTTGSPKGVVLETQQVGSSVLATLDALEVREHDKSCQWLPLSHDMGLIGGLFTAWSGSERGRLGSSAGQYVCISPELFMARPMIWLERCASMQATITAAPAFAYHILARQLQSRAQLDLRNLRVALVGAEPILPHVLEGFVEAASPHGFNAKALCPAYGLAEATLAVSMVRPDELWSTFDLKVDGQQRRYVGCGRPLSCVEVDAPHTGVPGPIRVRGAAVSREFIPARTEPNQSGWLDSRDLGLFSNGQLVVTGRSDDMLCVAGRNVFAWELETEAARIEGIRAGSCVVVPDGLGRYALLFEIASKDESGAEELLPALRGRLTAYAGVGPSVVGCLPKGHLPKTPSGKLQRQQVRVDLRRYLEQCSFARAF